LEHFSQNICIMAAVPTDIVYDNTTGNRRQEAMRRNGKGRFAAIWANKKVLMIAAAASSVALLKHP